MNKRQTKTVSGLEKQMRVLALCDSARGLNLQVLGCVSESLKLGLTVIMYLLLDELTLLAE